MRLIRGVAAWMVAAILVAIVSDGRPPLVQIVVGSFVLIVIGLFVANDVYNHRAQLRAANTDQPSALPPPVSPPDD